MHPAKDFWNLRFILSYFVNLILIKSLQILCYYQVDLSQCPCGKRSIMLEPMVSMGQRSYYLDFLHKGRRYRELLKLHVRYRDRMIKNLLDLGLDIHPKEENQCPAIPGATVTNAAPLQNYMSLCKWCGQSLWYGESLCRDVLHCNQSQNRLKTYEVFEVRIT
jgi:hypothetical protein